MASRFRDLDERVEYLEKMVAELVKALADSGTALSKKDAYDISLVLNKEVSYKWDEEQSPRERKYTDDSA